MRIRDIICAGVVGLMLTGCGMKDEGDDKPSAVSAPASPYGIWTCEGSQFILTEETFSNAPQNKITNVLESGGGYVITLDDGYQFAMLDVTETSHTWKSLKSQDTVSCTR